MKLLKRASALLKDRNSIYLARLSRKTSSRHPELQEAVIKATSHDESKVDYKNAQRIFTWIRTSPKFVKPVIWALSNRMDKTQSWIVALKGLLLMHGIFCCKTTALHRIGRLPFDFSNFKDGYSDSPRVWGYNAFIRAYFAFLDQKSVIGGCEGSEGNKGIENPLMDTLEELRKSQALLDMLLQVKPYSDVWHHVLILEAMDCIVIEIFDVYSKICSGIAGVLVRIYAACQQEAETALHVLHKATTQGDALDSYFEFCRDIGVLNASDFPRVEKIPDEDIRDLEKIINEISKERNKNSSLVTVQESHEQKKKSQQTETSNEDSTKISRTIITDNWVVFEDEFKAEEERLAVVSQASTNNVDPFAASINVPPLLCSSNDAFTSLNPSLQTQNYNSMQGALVLSNGDQSSNGLLQSQHYYSSMSGAMATNRDQNSNGLLQSQQYYGSLPGALQPQQYYSSFHGDQRSNSLPQPQQYYISYQGAPQSTYVDQTSNGLLQAQHYYTSLPGPLLSMGGGQKSNGLLQPQPYYTTLQGAQITCEDERSPSQQYNSSLQGTLLLTGADQRLSSFPQMQQYYSPMQGTLSPGGDPRANALLQLQQYYGSMQGALSNMGNQRNLILSL